MWGVFSGPQKQWSLSVTGAGTAKDKKAKAKSGWLSGAQLATARDSRVESGGEGEKERRWWF